LQLLTGVEFAKMAPQNVRNDLCVLSDLAVHVASNNTAFCAWPRV
jgi:hypothetical protein